MTRFAATVLAARERSPSRVFEVPLRPVRQDPSELSATDFSHDDWVGSQPGAAGGRRSEALRQWRYRAPVEADLDRKAVGRMSGLEWPDSTLPSIAK